MKRAAGLEPAELTKIGRQILRLARDLVVEDQTGVGSEVHQFKPLFSSLARDEISERQARRKQFGVDLFGEPSWEMLLHLYIAKFEGQSLPTKAVLAASGAPTTTALRHLSELELKGLVTRKPSNKDQRVILIELTEKAYRKFHTYFLNRLEMQDKSSVSELPLTAAEGHIQSDRS